MTKRRQRVARMTEGEITAQLWAAKAQKAYEALILAQNAAGAITWTLDEQEEIEKLAKALRQDVGQPCQPMIERARAAHDDDARTIETWTRERQPNCDICARLRRRRAGRVIGFRLAGLALDRLRYTLKVTSLAPSAEGNDHLYRYGSKADAETAQTEIAERAAKFGERYMFEISEGEEV